MVEAALHLFQCLTYFLVRDAFAVGFVVDGEQDDFVVVGFLCKKIKVDDASTATLPPSFRCYGHPYFVDVIGYLGSSFGILFEFLFEVFKVVFYRGILLFECLVFLVEWRDSSYLVFHASFNNSSTGRVLILPLFTPAALRAISFV